MSLYYYTAYNIALTIVSLYDTLLSTYTNLNMEINIIDKNNFKNTRLAPLLEIPEPPQKLYYQGQLPENNIPLLTVVGSRKYSTYGKQALEDILAGLKSYRVGIISGLAIGIDTLAHEAALKHSLYTISIPGSGLSTKSLYPARNKSLAQKIITSGGCLLSEYEPEQKATKWSFPARNRLMAGLGDATLLIEATERSGTLITARLATDYNKDVLVVPGSIYSEHTKGTHQFLKLGAYPVTCSQDIIDLLHLEKKSVQDSSDAQPSLFSEAEQAIVDTLVSAKNFDELQAYINIDATKLSSTLMKLELTGVIRCENGLYSKKI